MTLISAFQDERQFSKVFDFHSYAREVRINYGDCANLPTLVDDYFKDIAQVIADKMDYVQARSCCMGGNIHYSYHHHGSLAFLVETATSFQPPSDAMKEEVFSFPFSFFFSFFFFPRHFSIFSFLLAC